MYNEGFIVCSSSTKEYLIKKSNEIKNYIYITQNDLIEAFYGKCSKKSIYLLMKKYNISYDFSKECISYIPYINIDEKYESDKLAFLKEMKKYLISIGEFSKNEMLLYRLKNYPITLLEHDDTYVFNNIKTKLNEITKVYEINKEKNNKKLNVNCFDDVKEEAKYILNSIIDLNKKGVTNEHIFINNITSELKNEFLRLIKTYKMPIDLEVSDNIKSLDITKRFLSLLNECDTFNSVFESLNDYKDSVYYAKLFNLVIDYSFIEENPKDTYDFFINALKDIKLEKKNYKNSIKTKECMHDDADYLFIPSLNLGAYPKICKDDLYLNDLELSKIGLPSSLERNKEAYNKALNTILTTKNIYLSYVKKSDGKEVFKSNILEDLDIKEEDQKASIGYSKIEDDLSLGVSLSMYHKFKTIDDNLEKYDVSHLKFNTYDNKYMPFDSSLLDDKFKNKVLSYSSLKTYYSCPFDYFCQYILKVDEKETTSSTRIGDDAHKILQKSYDEGFDLEKVYSGVVESHKKDSDYTKADFFYLNLIKDDVLKKLIEFNKENEGYSLLDQRLLESEVKIDGEYPFYGRIDKVLYKEIDGVVYAVIIDYKTGDDKMALNNVEDGYNLQLPSYMYLLKNYFKEKEVIIIGVYKQMIHRDILKFTDLKGKDFNDVINNKFKLEGFCIDDVDKYELFDKKNAYVKIRITTNGVFYSNSKVMNKDEEDGLIETVKELIKKAYNNIRNAKFDITHRVMYSENEIEKQISSCTYCKNKDICFKKYEDRVNVDYTAFRKE